MTSIIHFLALLVSLRITGMVVGSSTPNPLIDGGKWIFHSFHGSIGLYWKGDWAMIICIFYWIVSLTQKSIGRKYSLPDSSLNRIIFRLKTHFYIYYLERFTKCHILILFTVDVSTTFAYVLSLSKKIFSLAMYSKAQLHNTRVRNCGFVKKNLVQ